MSLDQPALYEPQYESLTRGCGFVHLDGWTSVAITGADRVNFLHSFCTNDVEKLQPGDSCEAFITTVKGKILGHVLVSCRQDELVLITVPGQAHSLIQHLDRYIIRENVELVDTSGSRSYVLLAGPDTQALIARLEREQTPPLAMGLRQHSAQDSEPAQDAVPVEPIRWQLTGPHDRLLEVAAGSLGRLQSALSEAGARECNWTSFDAARIEAGTPLVGIDFDESNLPQEIDRNEKAVSFTKGCYLGQETVARIDALGHVNRLLVGVRFRGEHPPPAGTELACDGRSVGRATSVTWSPALRAPLALAIIRRDWARPGTELASPSGACEVVALPVREY